MAKHTWVLIAFFVTIICLILLCASLIIDTKILNIRPKIILPTPTLIPSPKPTATPTQTPTPTPRLIPTFTPTPRPIPPKPTIAAPLSLDELFTKYGTQYNVDKEVLKKIAGCESGFNPNAVNNDYAGLFQFASFAWTEARGRMSLDNNQNLRFNAEESIKTAAFEINYKGTSGWSDCD